MNPNARFAVLCAFTVCMLAVVMHFAGQADARKHNECKCKPEACKACECKPVKLEVIEHKP